MSAVSKAANAGLWGLGLFVVFVAVIAAAIYVNMGSVAKEIVEKNASAALGVPVTIEKMDVDLEARIIVVRNINVANPQGYRAAQSITIGEITLIAESMSKDAIIFKNIDVTDAVIGLEVIQSGTNIATLRNNAAAAAAQSDQVKHPPKIIIREMTINGAQIKPEVLLVENEGSAYVVPEIRVTGIGEEQGGISGQEAIAQASAITLQQFLRSANTAGFFEGLPLEVINEMGVSTLDVFGKNLKKAFERDIEKLNEGINQGVDAVKKLFAE